MRPVRTEFLLALAVGITACHGGKGGSASAPGPQIGTYDYRARIGTYEMRGVMIVLGDTVLVRPESEYCQPVYGMPDQLNFRFECAGTADFEKVFLRIDRRNPVMASKWSATYTTPRQRQVCVRYATDARGRRVCVEFRVETYTERTTQSGVLSVRPRPGGS
jgi:hypothetical protein